MITIGNLSNRTDSRDYTYSDLHLDFQEKKSSNNAHNSDAVRGNDVIVDTDATAIRNSIINILMQRRYFNSEFNVNMKQYIGEFVSDMTSRSIGDAIDKGLHLFEPRIIVDKIAVFGDPETFSYKIAILYSLKNFKNSKSLLSGELNSLGEFRLVNNNE